jgi:hypothetical protein
MTEVWQLNQLSTVWWNDHSHWSQEMSMWYLLLKEGKCAGNVVDVTLLRCFWVYWLVGGDFLQRYCRWSHNFRLIWWQKLAVLGRSRSSYSGHTKIGNLRPRRCCLRREHNSCARGWCWRACWVWACCWFLLLHSIELSHIILNFFG